MQQAVLPTSRIQKKYDIGQKVIVIGVGDHLEIWDEERYLTERDACGNLEDLAVYEKSQRVRIIQYY